MMKIIRHINEMQRFADEARCAGETIGFVPTMGYFHEGHVSLMHLAKERASLVVVSIFVNPTQFGPNEDLSRYPRDFERDQAMCQEAGVDVIYAPEAGEMYPDGYQTRVFLEEIPKHLCGAARPVHFGGVATVCTKLFAAVKPHFAVLGEKDWQQLQVLRRLVKDLNLDVEIVPGPLYREDDGLAMSSRNVNLSPEERLAAPVIRKSLLKAQGAYYGGERDVKTLEEIVRKHLAEQDLLTIDYIHVAGLDSCAPLAGTVEGGAILAVAVNARKARLIDNVVLDDK